MSTPAINHELKVTFSNDSFFQKKNNELPWLTDSHVGSGIVQAIRDAKEKNAQKWSHKKIETDFMAVGNLPWMIGDKLTEQAERILGCQLKQKSLVFDKYYFFHVNNEPYTKKGKHWTILSIYIPKKEYDTKTVIVFNYFDSMGDPIQDAVFSFIKDHVSRVLETNMKKKFNENVTFNYEKLHYEHNAIQNDGYQCGVWCIWYVHNFILQFPNPFKTSDNISDPKDFRKLYFKVEIDLISDKKVEELPDDVEEVTEQVRKKEIDKQSEKSIQVEQSHLQQPDPQPADILKKSLKRLRQLTSAEIAQLKMRRLQEQT
jgi:hypothetical protein